MLELSPDDPRLATGFGSLVDLEKIMESLGEDVVRLDDDVVGGVGSWRYGASHTRTAGHSCRAYGSGNAPRYERDAE